MLLMNPYFDAEPVKTYQEPMSFFSFLFNCDKNIETVAENK